MPAISRRRPSMGKSSIFTRQSLLGAFSRVFSGVCIFILNYLPYRSWLASQQTFKSPILIDERFIGACGFPFKDVIPTTSLELSIHAPAAVSYLCALYENSLVPTARKDKWNL